MKEQFKEKEKEMEKMKILIYAVEVCLNFNRKNLVSAGDLHFKINFSLGLALGNFSSIFNWINGHHWKFILKNRHFQPKLCKVARAKTYSQIESLLTSNRD